MNQYVYDLEVYHDLFSAGFKSTDGSEYHLFVLHAGQDDIQKLRDWIDSFNGELTLIGHNILGYDNLIINAIFEFPGNINNASLKRLSDKIITQRETFRMTDVYKQLRWYAQERWKSYDTMEITRINQMRVGLKFAGVILKCTKVQDLPYPPDARLTPEQIRAVISYMENDIDVNIVLWETIQRQVKIRHDVESLFGVDVHTLNDTGVGKAILNHFYIQDTEFSSTKEILDSVPEPPGRIRLANCIAKDICFETPLLQKIVTGIREHVVYSYNNYRNDLKFDLNGNITSQKQKHAITYDGTQYAIGVGGLHSVDLPGKFVTNNKYIIRDADVSSYYPNIIIVNNFTPAHLGYDFIKILIRLTKQRLWAKEKGHLDPYYATMAASLKITINSIFGLLGNKYYWLYSPETFLSVTISGQLYLLDLIEKLSLIGIQTISANTDGIVCKIPRELEDKYYKVCREWSTRTKMNLEYTDYVKYVRRDVNNYITVKPNGNVKTKGCFYPGELKDGIWTQPLNKGYNAPIIAIAMYQYFVNDTAVVETIRNHTDIYDFMIAKRVDTNKYQPTLVSVNAGQIVKINLQKTNRFLVTEDGGSFEKVSTQVGLNSSAIAVGKRITLVNNVDNTGVAAYNINYNYYVAECNKVIYKIEPREIILF